MAETRVRTNSRTINLMIGVLLIAFLTGSSCSRPVTPAPPVTTVATVILVRHAEKVLTDPKDKNALLTPAGEARARELVHVLGDAGITSIFATQVTRTQQTAKPIADKLGLPVTQVEATNTVELVKQIKAKPVGSVTLVVGHTNSIPEVITALGAGTIPIIPETEYDHLFVVTVDSSGKATLAKLRYGTATP